MLQISVFSFNFEKILSYEADELCVWKSLYSTFIFEWQLFRVNISRLAFKKLFYSALNQTPSTPGL